VADRWIYHAQAYFALATFFLVGWCLLFVVHRFRDADFHDRRQTLRELASGPAHDRWSRRVVLIASLMLFAAVLRLAWQGAPLLIASAITLLVTIALALSDRLPTVARIVTTTISLPLLGVDRVGKYGHASVTTPDSPNQSTPMAVVLPVVALLVFGGIFVMANPDLVSTVSNWLSNWAERFWLFISNLSIWEIPFCILAFFVGAGLMRPFLSLSHEPMLRLLGTQGSDFSAWVDETVSNQVAASEQTTEASSLYPAFRNTLLTLIALFAAYLIFEFTTLWARDFPAGFYYAGYAHEGAAWLTVALALATLTMSFIFTGQIHRDHRVGRLMKLAWVWSAMNLMLAVAVYNRLSIYVGYNGMTRMRTIGFFGITLVVTGLILVIWKISRRRSFAWLIQVQSLALIVAAICYSLFPVDYVVHRYNASAVAMGYLQPSVMIAVKPINDEGMFPLFDLLDTSDPIIREGVRAQMAERQLAIESYSWDRPWHWHRTQYSKTRLYRKLQQFESNWTDYRTDADARTKAIERLKTYAMQWY